MPTLGSCGKVVTLLVFAGAAHFSLPLPPAQKVSFALYKSISHPSFRGNTRKRRDEESELKSKEKKRETEGEGGRDDALRAVIDVRTAWMGARHLRPFSLPLPTPTDCHHQRRAEYQPLFLMNTLHFFYTSSQPDHRATVLPSTQTICYSFKTWMYQ